ncbi:hypothetical protein BR93DRAFT_608073 [Coniochaeta sp. PMI_546]|nr:hypothetical protein BR93DRAFT_608073 [Coniochaeta sp. PMI_546]
MLRGWKLRRSGMLGVIVSRSWELKLGPGINLPSHVRAIQISNFSHRHSAGQQPRRGRGGEGGTSFAASWLRKSQQHRAGLGTMGVTAHWSETSLTGRDTVGRVLSCFRLGVDPTNATTAVLLFIVSVHSPFFTSQLGDHSLRDRLIQRPVLTCRQYLSGTLSSSHTLRLHNLSFPLKPSNHEEFDSTSFHHCRLGYEGCRKGVWYC